MRRTLCLAVLLLLPCGCTSLRDSAVRGMLMDHRLHRELLPRLQDSYRLKMRAPLPAGGGPAPSDMDRG